MIPLFFLLGVITGIAASVMSGVRSHQARFNNVCAGIIGGLAGGLQLAPRLRLRLRLPLPDVMGIRSAAEIFIVAVAAATILISLLNVATAISVIHSE